jgi:NTE family protein
MAVSELLEGRRVGIVLSGGGAKGAYQIGMFRALEELGLEHSRMELSGTSIGALNALLFAIRGTSAMHSLMEDMREFLCGDPRRRGKKPEISADDVVRVMRDLYPDSLLEKNSVPVTVCAYCQEAERPEYFQLNGLLPGEQRLLVLASACIPGFSDPIPYRGRHYTDGGILPAGASGNASVDKIPLCVFRQSAADPVLVSYLTVEDQVDPRLIGSRRLIEIRPEAPLERAPHAGTLDFSAENVRNLEERGYQETIRLFARLGE